MSCIYDTAMLFTNNSLDNKRPLISYVTMLCHWNVSFCIGSVLVLVPPGRWRAVISLEATTPGMGSVTANLSFTKIQMRENIEFHLNIYFSSFSTCPSLLLRMRNESEIRHQITSYFSEACCWTNTERSYPDPTLSCLS